MFELYRIFSSSCKLKECSRLRKESLNSTQEDMIKLQSSLPAPERYVRKQKSANKMSNTHSASTCIAPQSSAAAASFTKSVVLYADPYYALFEATFCPDAVDKVYEIGELNYSRYIILENECSSF